MARLADPLLSPPPSQINKSSPTKQIDDGTGVIGCRIFVDQGESEYQQERRMLCQKGAYVRVVGQMREYQVRI
jgi:RPA family protein